VKNILENYQSHIINSQSHRSVCQVCLIISFD
jgi:hypothetical protein